MAVGQRAGGPDGRCTSLTLDGSTADRGRTTWISPLKWMYTDDEGDDISSERKGRWEVGGKGDERAGRGELGELPGSAVGRTSKYDRLQRPPPRPSPRHVQRYINSVQQRDTLQTHQKDKHMVIPHIPRLLVGDSRESASSGAQTGKRASRKGTMARWFDGRTEDRSSVCELMTASRQQVSRVEGPPEPARGRSDGGTHPRTDATAPLLASSKSVHVGFVLDELVLYRDRRRGEARLSQRCKQDRRSLRKRAWGAPDWIQRSA